MKATAHVYVIGRQLRSTLCEIERTAFQLGGARSITEALAVLAKHAEACELLEQSVAEYRAALQAFHDGCKALLDGRLPGGRP